MVNQVRYSLLDRAPEREVLPIAQGAGIGVIAFSPLAQGLLTAKYLRGIPAHSRAVLNQGNGALDASGLTPQVTAMLNALNELALQRSQTLAQLALAWLLKDARVTSVLIGASRPEQVIECVGCLERLDFAPQELAAVEHALSTA